MKYFFHQDKVLAADLRKELITQAKKELREKTIKIDEMSTKMELICFNAGAVNEYIPKGMDTLITTKNIVLDQKLSPKHLADVDKAIKNCESEVIGYVFSNIQTKKIENYLDLTFDLKRDFTFDPYICTHFSDTELLDYLVMFLNQTEEDKVPRKVEVYENLSKSPWKTFFEGTELLKVDCVIRQPVVLDKCFFSEIRLNIMKNNIPNVQELPFGKLKSVMGNFNKSRGLRGETLRSKTSLFFTWKNIDGIKLSATQGKSFLGVSYKGEMIASSSFMSKGLSSQFIHFKDIDFFRLKVGNRAMDIKPEDIRKIEVNLEVQQTILTIGVGKDENHISRVASIVLHKGDVTTTIHKIIPFNRGESNFENFQVYFGSRFAELEKSRHLLQDKQELNYLKECNIASGDLLSHLVLSSMKMLDVLPIEQSCIGFSPDDIKNPTRMKENLVEWFNELKTLFSNILDLSKTPNFTEHNFNRRTKSIREFQEFLSVSQVTGESLHHIIEELDDITIYMDDFFKLNIYNQYQDDLEVDSSPQDQEEEELADLTETDTLNIDDDTKNFIGENFSFFLKRNNIQDTLVKVERMLFYFEQIKPFIQNEDYHPDVVVYSSHKSVTKNYQHASYPAFSLTDVIPPKLLLSKNETEDLRFVRFMRSFTEKVYTKAKELNKSFHHQYKHTLAELTFLMNERLDLMKEELNFLESPEHKEEAYQKLFEKITALYQKHLAEKKSSIEELLKEQEEVQQKFSENFTLLKELTGEDLTEETLSDFLETIPQRLEKRRRDIMAELNKKKPDISKVLTAHSKFFQALHQYFVKVLGYANLFQKALFIRQKQRMYQEVQKQVPALFKLPEDKLKQQILKLKKYKYDAKAEKVILGEVTQQSRKMKETIIQLKSVSGQGLFQAKDKEKGSLTEYINYFSEDMGILKTRIKKIQPIHQQLSGFENGVFKKLEEHISNKVSALKYNLLLKICSKILKNPDCKEEIESLLTSSEAMPSQIKEELADLRTQMGDALEKFKRATSPAQLDQVADFSKLTQKAEKREKINEVAKDLVNFKQGLDAIKEEIKGENNDLDYMISQEDNLEKVAMSKALPSTRVLIKTQYIPMIERELEMLSRGNDYLGEVVSKGQKLIGSLNNTYFRKRYGFQQFTSGVFCMDNSRGAKDHTEKNINSALLLLGDRYSAACAVVKGQVNKIGFRKLTVMGTKGIKDIIASSWSGNVEESFIYLSAGLSILEVIQLCEFKEKLIKEKPLAGKSVNSLVLVYIGEIKYSEILEKKDLLTRYHKAIIGNIFINVDGVTVFNNRQSIYEACVGETFGMSNDPKSQQIAENFMMG